MSPSIPLPQTASGKHGRETRGLPMTSCVFSLGFPTTFTVGCAA